jgi:hypothetical protein
MFRAIRRELPGASIEILLAAAGAVALAGVAMTVGVSALWFAAAVVPPAVILLVWRGAPPPTIAEVLHAVDRRD